MPCNAPLDVLAHDKQPDHAGQQLDQRKDGDQQRRLRQDLGDLHGEEVSCYVATFVAGEGSNLGGLHQDHAQALDEHNGLNEVRGLRVGTVEACLLIFIANLLTDDDQGDNAKDGAQAQQFVHEVVQAPIADDWPTALGIEDLDVGLEPHHGSQQESDHDQPVSNRYSRLLSHLGVADDLLNQVHQSAGGIVRPLQRRLAEADRGKDLRRATDEENPGGQ